MSAPPTRIASPADGSYAAAAKPRGEGWCAGASFVQLVPSHAQVSPRLWFLVNPPKRMRRPSGPATSAPPSRGGGEVAGCSWIHAPPSQLHVSLSSVGSLTAFDP